MNTCWLYILSYIVSVTSRQGINITYQHTVNRVLSYHNPSYHNVPDPNPTLTLTQPYPNRKRKMTMTTTTIMMMKMIHSNLTHPSQIPSQIPSSQSNRTPPSQTPSQISWVRSTRAPPRCSSWTSLETPLSLPSHRSQRWVLSLTLTIT